MNDKMEHVGLEVELAQMIAKALGVELKIVVVTGANRVACLLTECADILIYGLTITPERATQVWFSQPYAINASGIIATKGTTIASINDLVGKKRRRDPRRVRRSGADEGRSGRHGNPAL